MSHFTLGTLARLALKNHQELQSLFAPSSSVPALQLALQLAGVDAGLEFSCAANNAIRFTLSQGVRSISLQVAPNAQSLDEARITVTMCQRPYTAHTAVCTGKEFMATKADAGFAELLEAAKQHLSQFFKANGPAKAQGNTEPAEAPAQAPAAEEKPVQEFFPVTVMRENQPNLRFNGKLLARVATVIRNGRQHVYSVYLTEGGKRIGVKEGLSQWLAEKDIVNAEVLDTDADLTKFFGFNAVAKELYARLNLAHCAEEVVA